MKKIIILIGLGIFLLSGQLYSQGCVEADSDEGITIIGFIQPQIEYQFLGEDNKGKSLDKSSFYFNRARLGVTGFVPYDFQYYFVMEFSPTINGATNGQAPKLLDAFIGYNRFAPYLKASFGQFKAPFGIELPTACHKLYTINRSLVVENLVHPWRDLTFMVYGTTGAKKILGIEVEDFLGYNLALTNGTGIGVMDDNNFKDILGRVTIRPAKFLTLGASYRYGKKPPAAEGVEEEDVRKRLGLDLAVNYKNLIIQGEFIQGEDIGSYTTGGGCGGDVEVHEGTINRSGYFVQAAYMTPWNLQPVLKFETYDPNLDLENPNVFDEAIENTITFGINYFFNERTRFQLNYLYNAEENGKVEIPNDVILAQFQISFK